MRVECGCGETAELECNVIKAAALLHDTRDATCHGVRSGGNQNNFLIASPGRLVRKRVAEGVRGGRCRILESKFS